MTANGNDTQNNESGTLSDGFQVIDPPDRFDRTRRSTWILIFFLSLFLHASLILFLWIVRPFSARGFETRPPEPIQLVFVDENDPPMDQPNTFTELPDDRRGDTPENPDFLSNMDSRARDDVDGGVMDAMPRLSGESEAPHLSMDPEIPGSPPTVQPVEETETMVAESSPYPRRNAALNDAGEASSEGADLPGVGSGKETTEARKDDSEVYKEPVSDDRERGETRTHDASPERTPPRRRIPPLSGTADIYQEAMEFRSGNTALSGIVSMNTTAWAYAPWLQRFRRNLMRSWLAPVAYYMGIVHGHTMIDLEIAPDGTLLNLNVVEEEGHVSLHETSTSLFTVLAPYHPLPPDFPEKSLMLRIKLVYPPRR